MEIVPPSATQVPKTPAKCALRAGDPCSACADLEALDCQLEQQPGIMHLKAEREALVRRVNGRHDPLSYHLPTELISHIFGLYPACSGYTNDIYSSPPQGAFGSPFRLTSVCTAWREIGINTPALWASLLISIRSPGCLKRQLDGFDLVPTWLKRAGDLPLRICIHFCYAQYRALYPFAALFSLVSDYAHRWKALSISVPRQLCKVLFHKCSLEAPMLEYLQLNLPSGYFPRGSIPMKLKSPTLATVTINNMNTHRTALDWEKVTDVSTAGLLGREIGTIFRLAPHLEIARLQTIYPDQVPASGPIDSVPKEIHIHESITSLDLAVTDKGHPVNDSFLDYLAFPRLQTLAVNFRYARTPALQHSLVGCISRSHCAVTSLALEEIHTTVLYPETLTRILELLPSITHLRLTSVRAEATSLAQIVFRRLSRPETPAFLPHLEDLTCEEWALSNRKDVFTDLANVFDMPGTPAPDAYVPWSSNQDQSVNRGTSNLRVVRPIRILRLVLKKDASTPRRLLVIPRVPLACFQQVQQCSMGGVQLIVVAREFLGEQDLVKSSVQFYNVNL